VHNCSALLGIFASAAKYGGFSGGGGRGGFGGGGGGGGQFHCHHFLVCMASVT